MSEQGGYDLSFVAEVPDYLQCVVCQLVLRDPVLIIACGHRFCGQCFRQLQARATTAHVQFTCPIDQAIIDTAKVCEDLGFTRVIGCLVVRCDYHARGCQWEGELSELPTHLAKCEFSLPASQTIHPEVAVVIKKLEGRLDVAEKDIADMKEVMRKQTDEIRELKKNDMEKSRKLEELVSRILKMEEEEEERQVAEKKTPTAPPLALKGDRAGFEDLVSLKVH